MTRQCKPKKRSAGRPRKLRDKRTREKFLNEIRGGLTFTQACYVVDIAKETFRNECLRDPKFREEVDKARGVFVARIVKALVRHAEDDPATCRHVAACVDKRFRKPEAAGSTTHTTHVNVSIEQQNSAVIAALTELGLGHVLAENTGPSTAAGSGPAIGSSDGLPASPGIEADADRADDAAGGLPAPDLP